MELIITIVPWRGWYVFNRGNAPCLYMREDGFFYENNPTYFPNRTDGETVISGSEDARACVLRYARYADATITVVDVQKPRE